MYLFVSLTYCYSIGVCLLSHYGVCCVHCYFHSLCKLYMASVCNLYGLVMLSPCGAQYSNSQSWGNVEHLSVPLKSPIALSAVKLQSALVDSNGDGLNITLMLACPPYWTCELELSGSRFKLNFHA
ncbi:hypothetical protein QQ045_022457 [Rhodiola kirilowii]